MIGNQPALVGNTLIAGLVDRSGSMAVCLADTESGFNSFVRDQAALPGDVDVMLAQFDNEYEVVWPLQPIRQAPAYRLEPRGGTALFDAVGRYIGEINEMLTDEEVWRPVIMVITTDGADNRSQEWDRESVRAWIQHQRDVYKWVFIFLGANLDAVKVGTSLGIPTENALTFHTRNTRSTFALLSRHVAEVRAGIPAGFSADDRRKAIGS